MFKAFAEFDIVRNGVRLHGRAGGQGAPLLLLHGHPQSHVMWHQVAPQLAEKFTVVMMDLRGYGDSGRPTPTKATWPIQSERWRWMRLLSCSILALTASKCWLMIAARASRIDWQRIRLGRSSA